MTRNDILDGARSAVGGDRDHNYGGPEASFTSIAQMWTVYIEHTGRHCMILPEDVAAMMALLKIVRIAKTPEHMDSWVDLAGYAACGGECADIPTAVEITRDPNTGHLEIDEMHEERPHICANCSHLDSETHECRKHHFNPDILSVCSNFEEGMTAEEHRSCGSCKFWGGGDGFRGPCMSNKPCVMYSAWEKSDED